MKGVFCFRVKNKDGKEGIWIVDAKNGTGSVSYGGPGGYTCYKHLYLYLYCNSLDEVAELKLE